MTWSFIPRKSGRRRILSGSSPAVTAQVARQSPHEAPEVTNASSAPVSSASRLPTLACSSWMRTKLRDACSIASFTSGSIRVPLKVVSVPTALIKVLTPKRSYGAEEAGGSPAGDISHPTPVAAVAPGDDQAASGNAVLVLHQSHAAPAGCDNSIGAGPVSSSVSCLALLVWAVLGRSWGEKTLRRRSPSRHQVRWK